MGDTNFRTEKLLGQLKGDEKEGFIGDIKDQFPYLKKTGSTRQIQALEKVIDTNGPARKNSSANPTDATSTPSLTNGTHSSSSSPPSTHASAVSMPAEEGPKRAVSSSVADVVPQVQETED